MPSFTLSVLCNCQFHSSVLCTIISSLSHPLYYCQLTYLLPVLLSTHSLHPAYYYLHTIYIHFVISCSVIYHLHFLYRFSLCVDTPPFSNHLSFGVYFVLVCWSCRKIDLSQTVFSGLEKTLRWIFIISLVDWLVFCHVVLPKCLTRWYLQVTFLRVITSSWKPELSRPAGPYSYVIMGWTWITTEYTRHTANLWLPLEYSEFMACRHDPSMASTMTQFVHSTTHWLQHGFQ